MYYNYKSILSTFIRRVWTISWVMDENIQKKRSTKISRRDKRPKWSIDNMFSCHMLEGEKKNNFKKITKPSHICILKQIDRQTVQKSCIMDVLWLVVFSQKNQQSVLNSRREIYYGRADKLNYRVASLLKAK